MIMCVSPPITYSVAYSVYPIDLDTPDRVKNALDSARAGSLSRVAKEDPHIIKEFDISIDGHPGRFLQIELKGDAMIRMRCLVAANRVYVLGAGAPKKKPAVVDATNDYEAIATLNFIETSLVVSASLFTEPTGFLHR